MDLHTYETSLSLSFLCRCTGEMCIVVGGECPVDKNGCAYVTNSWTKARAQDETHPGVRVDGFPRVFPVVKDGKDRKTAAQWPLTRAKGERPRLGERGERNERNGDGEIICHGGQTNP